MPQMCIVYDNCYSDKYTVKTGDFGLANLAATTVEFLGYEPPKMWKEPIISLK